MTSSMILTLSAAEPSTELTELPAPAWVFGLIAFALFTVLLIVTMTFNRDR